MVARTFSLLIHGHIRLARRRHQWTLCYFVHLIAVMIILIIGHALIDQHDLVYAVNIPNDKLFS